MEPKSERPAHLCLFCLNDASTSTGEAHIVPESLGNSASLQDEVLVLPPGSVCDRCNGGRFGSKVESSFIQDDAGIFARLRGIPAKKGRYPTVSLPKHSTTLEFTHLADGAGPLPPSLSAGPVKLKTLRTSRSIGPTPKDAEPTASFNIQIKLQPKHHFTSAFLSKLVIEYIAFTTSKATALHPALDSHRRNALRSTPQNFLAYYRGKSDLDALFNISYSFPDNVFSFTYSQFRFILPLLVPPNYSEYPQWDGLQLIRPDELNE